MPEVVDPVVVEPVVVEPVVVEPVVVEPERAVLEMDEMWTFVGKRKRKVWLWLAVERAPGALWFKYWAAGARLRGGGFFNRCLRIIESIQRNTPMPGKPMPRSCPPTRTSLALKAAGKPTLWKR